MNGQTLLLVLHLAGNLLWIGGITALAVALATPGPADARRPIALAIYRRVAVPGFVASLVGGGAMLFMNPALYLSQTHWMHPKLVLALVIIALHHVLGARAKRLSQGEAIKGAAPMGAVLVICAVSAAFLALAKPF